MAFFGKFYGVAYKVKNNLAHTTRITHQKFGRIGRKIDKKFKHLFPRNHLQDIRDFFNSDIEIKINRLQFQPACLDF